MGGDRNTGRNRIVRKKIEMDDDRLIELVRRNPSLYELDHSSYNSGIARAQTWNAIGAELKRRPLFCKKRWGNIRDNYKKAMKKYYWRLSQGFTHVKKYKFFDKLHFLEHQIADEEKREQDQNKKNLKEEEEEGAGEDKHEGTDGALEVKCEPDIDPEYDDTSSYDNCNLEYYQKPENYRCYFNPHRQNVPFEPNCHQNHNEEDTTTEPLLDNYSQAETRISTEVEPVEKEPEYDENEGDGDDDDDDMDKLLSPKIEIFGNSRHLGLSKRSKRKPEELENELNTSNNSSKSMRYFVERFERHPVDAFLSGIAPTLKSFSPYYLSLAKTQIYSIVQEYEMAMIMERRNENRRI